MIAGADGPLGLVVEEPIDRFEFVALVGFQVVQQRGDQGQAEVVGIPGADAEEVGEVAGIDAVEFLSRQFGEGLAAWRDEEVGQPLQVPQLGVVQAGGKAQESKENDDGQGTVYDGLHGSRVSKTVGLSSPLFYSRDLFSAAALIYCLDD
jgi:hypothetical protein